MNARQQSDVSSAKRLIEVTSDRVALGVGAGDVLQGKVIERSGFDFVWVSSLAVCSTLGKAEESGMRLGAYDMLVSAIVRGVSIPAMVDANLSGMDARGVAAAIEFVASIGAAAISIEDKPRPKTNSLDRRQRQEQLPPREFGRLVAAARAIAGDRVAIVARIESLVAGAGPEDTLSRMQLSQEAGADFMILHSRSSDPREVLDVVDAWEGSCRIGLIPTTYPSLSVSQLEPSKVAFVVFANQLTRASVRLHEQMLETIKHDQGTEGVGPQLAPVEHLFDYLEE